MTRPSTTSFPWCSWPLPPAGGRLEDSPPKPSEFTSSCPRRRAKLRPRRNYNRKGWAPGFPETHPLFRVFYFKALDRTLKAGGAGDLQQVEDRPLGGEDHRPHFPHEGQAALVVVGEPGAHCVLDQEDLVALLQQAPGGLVDAHMGLGAAHHHRLPAQGGEHAQELGASGVKGGLLNPGPALGHGLQQLGGGGPQALGVLLGNHHREVKLLSARRSSLVFLRTWGVWSMATISFSWASMTRRTASSALRRETGVLVLFHGDALPFSLVPPGGRGRSLNRQVQSGPRRGGRRRRDSP